jgi:hypothetical protein
MSQSGQILAIEGIQPGMTLAEAIRDRHGNVMLTEGTTLTEAHLAALRQRGVASALIVAEQAPPTTQEIEAIRRSIEARLQQIFRKTLDCPGNRRLYEVVLNYRLERLK